MDSSAILKNLKCYCPLIAKEHLLTTNSKLAEIFHPSGDDSLLVVSTKKNCLEVFASSLPMSLVMTGNPRQVLMIT